MRVLIVSIWDGGGIPTAMRFVADGLKDRNVTFDAFCFNGFHVHSRWAEFCENLYNHQECTLTELLVKRSYDVVHMVEAAGPPPYSANLWLERASYRGGVVCMCQNAIYELLPEQFAHVYIACSEGSRRFMEKFISKPIRLIPNGVDTKRFYPRSVSTPPKPVLAWVGRTSDLKQKDIFGFLHLVASLIDDRYDFWIVDGGGEREALRLAEWFGDRVRYENGLDAEALANIYSQVAASGGAILSTSAFEGLPFALLEAAACGCPVIAPQAPGLEYLEPDKTGLMYERLDGLKKLKVAVRALADESLRQRLIEGGFQIVRDQHKIRCMAEGYYTAFQDAVALAARTPFSWRDAVKGRFYAAALASQRALRLLKMGRIANRLPSQPELANAASLLSNRRSL